MKIAMFGASGPIASRIGAETVRRGHVLAAVSSHSSFAPAEFTFILGDLSDPASVARAVARHDAVISAAGVTASQVMAARALAAGLQEGGVRRLVVLGDGLGPEVVVSEDVPALVIQTRANRDTVAVYEQAADLDWTYVIPASTVSVGERTGRYRIGLAHLGNRAGQSRISAEDLAVALLDEVEGSRHLRQCVYVAY